MYRSILEAQSHVAVVGEAGDGRSAIEQAGEHQPDLILLDLLMPGMDGLEALPSIKEASPEQ